ncbi:MAG TPA: hypothetical protein VJ955_06780, partial [Desulfuromonadales bacterium]|nr:hypothetical protein [Desulfuromonadales bacterium]
ARSTSSKRSEKTGTVVDVWKIELNAGAVAGYNSLEIRSPLAVIIDEKLKEVGSSSANSAEGTVRGGIGLSKRASNDYWFTKF